MSLRLDQLLKTCTVRIEVSGTKSQGTGFFFAPKLILTCTHVVKNPVSKFVKVFPDGCTHPIPAEIKFYFPDEVDLAILEVHTHDKFPCVLLGAEVQPGDSCYTYGYSDSDQGFPTGDPVTLECEGITGGTFGKIKLKGGQVRPGLSGSPLLNFNTGKVCGVIKFTRGKSSDLGGGAVPMNYVFEKFSNLEKVHNDYHKSNTQWLNLLSFDTDALGSDWTYLDEGTRRQENYFKALFFLLKISFRWFILGRKAPRAFPFDTIKALTEHTLKGDLGQEIKRQRKDLTRRLIFEVDPEECYQAKILNELDSQAHVLGELINILITDKQDLASVSRLSWVAEVLYEQRSLIDELKKKEGNSYPKLEAFRKRFKTFGDTNENKYFGADKVVSNLVSRHTKTDLVLWNFLNSFLFDLIENFGINPKLNLILVENFFSWLSPDLVEQDKSSKSSVKIILEDLEEEARNNPQLKILRKIKILLETVAGELVQGGPFRAWSETGACHFNRRCKLYPERVKAEEMDKILCYDTRKEAERKHKPCKICLSAESLTTSKSNIIGDEPIE